MSYCPFCGEKIKDGEKCKGCGYVPNNGNSFSNSNGDKAVYEIPLWLKVVIIIAMILVSGGTIIGIIAGAVLSTSKDPKYKFYGKWLLKTSLIVLVVTLVISLVLFIVFAVIGTSAAIFMSPEPELNFTGFLTWLA